MMQNLIILPSADHLKLLDVLAILMLLIHIPYMGIVLGSTAISLFFAIKDKIQASERTQRLGRDVLEIVPLHIPVFFMLGALPLLTLMLIYSEWFYQTSLQITNYFGFVIGTTVVGLLFVYIYSTFRKKGNNITYFTLGIGCVGLLILKNAYYVLISTLTIFLFPEYWSILDLPLPVVYSWNAVARFMIFIISCCALTGLGILFFWFYQKKKEFDEVYGKFVKIFASALAMVGVFLLPACMLWNIGTMPTASFSTLMFIFYAIIFLLLAIVGYLLFRIISEPQFPVSAKSFVLFIFVIFFLITTDELAKENVNRGHVIVLSDKAELVKEQMEDKRTAGMKVTADLGLGEQIYKNKCSTCHAFDHKVVGPSHNEVLPKYVNDQETLKKFIRNPWKVNPSYPQMPAQGLNKKEVESVVAYMMKHIGAEPKAPPAEQKTVVK